ncbi:peptide-methionine (S)-S-oxide reductase MsrA [Roseibium sp. RKSG952]|uniref:peptide-methionine (S)-S-oxide reductase MsrA n=1 Tax=Roseibium sp. RKSG952 TaxID=2529384 RepID=UPI0012BC7C77|nr:peptide-methionine (S)-S-oxide reductase MsrA [Roseibium sp. RKSG952]MTI00036.1 peptide-methionine (S)-S-oxide reductase MsrA [Roseibium sp. RKSG952]
MSFMTMLSKRFALPERHTALPGRPVPRLPGGPHEVSGRALVPPYPEGSRILLAGMGRFRSAEQLFWSVPGVFVTAAGYAGGYTENPTHNEVHTGRTGHAEVVQVVYDPASTDLEALLALFWENHDPTQGMRQGSDQGTQFRSILIVEADDLACAQSSLCRYQAALSDAGVSRPITTVVTTDKPFYFAEDFHQQQAAKQPSAVRKPKGIGIPFPLHV